MRSRQLSAAPADACISSVIRSAVSCRSPQAGRISGAGGNADAIATMIDFYGGAGTFASWPPRVRAYAAETTPVNILDWASAYGFPLPRASLAALKLPTLVLHGGISHPAAKRANALLSECIPGATLRVIDGAAHFMIATHADEVGGLIAAHARRVEDAAR